MEAVEYTARVGTLPGAISTSINVCVLHQTDTWRIVHLSSSSSPLGFPNIWGRRNGIE